MSPPTCACPQTFVKNIADLVKIGDKIKIKVLNLDAESGKIALTMKGVEQGEQKNCFDGMRVSWRGLLRMRDSSGGSQQSQRTMSHIMLM